MAHIPSGPEQKFPWLAVKPHRLGGVTGRVSSVSSADTEPLSKADSVHTIEAPAGMEGKSTGFTTEQEGWDWLRGWSISLRPEGSQV